VTPSRREPITTAEEWADAIVVSHLREVRESRCVPADLMDLAAVVLCHDTAPDPKLVFTNRSAQRLWHRDWAEFVGLPSRLTAEPSERAARADALASSEVVRDYGGVRISATGARFLISGATIWPVYSYSLDGKRETLLGQAATFSSWEFI